MVVAVEAAGQTVAAVRGTLHYCRNNSTNCLTDHPLFVCMHYVRVCECVRVCV